MWPAPEERVLEQDLGKPYRQLERSRKRLIPGLSWKTIPAPAGRLMWHAAKAGPAYEDMLTKLQAHHHHRPHFPRFRRPAHTPGN